MHFWWKILNWLSHLEFNEFHVSFHNLRQIFRELCSHARALFHVWLDMTGMQSEELLLGKDLQLGKGHCGGSWCGRWGQAAASTIILKIQNL